MTPEETIREALVLWLEYVDPDAMSRADYKRFNELEPTAALDELVAERDRLGWALEPFAAWKDPPYGFLDDVETARLAFNPQGTNP